VVAAEQTLSQSISAYLAALQQQWQAAVDVAELLQLEDLSHLEWLACPPPA
jgi:hypothetical protein